MADDEEPADQPQSPQAPEPPDYVPPEPTGEIEADWSGPRPRTEVPLPRNQTDKKE